jgi:pyridoxal phosphate enzyme (YggS family)
MSVAENLRSFLKNIPGKVKLVAVSKTKPIETIREAYDAGQRVFGENKIQDLVAKQPLLPDDIKWHFIGHVQTNKVKYIAQFITLFHAIDSLKLLKEINKQAAKHSRVIDCLLQFHIAEEETKFGLSMEEAEYILNSDEYLAFSNINIVGVMGMATYTDDQEQVRKEFRQLKNYFDHLKNNYFRDEKSFKEISMGMSGDYKLAIEEGTTMIINGT